MKICSFRVCKKQFADKKNLGEGAKLYGGRWNNKGVAIIYTSNTKSLAAMEVLVNTCNADMLKDFVSFEFIFDEKIVENIEASSLPDGWDSIPTSPVSKNYGDKWIEKMNSPIIKVPSVIIKDEYSFLINPAHPEFSKIIIKNCIPFSFDNRLK